MTFIESTRCSIASPVTHHVPRLPSLNARCIRGFRQQLLCVSGEEGRGESVWAVGHQASLWPPMGAFSVLIQYHAWLAEDIHPDNPARDSCRFDKDLTPCCFLAVCEPGLQGHGIKDQVRRLVSS